MIYREEPHKGHVWLHTQNIDYQMSDRYTADKMIYEQRDVRIEVFPIKTHIIKPHMDLCFKPTRGSSFGVNRLLGERQRQNEQIGETGLIRPQKAIKSPSWIPENVNKVMVDKDQKDCVTKLLRTETSPTAARQWLRSSASELTALRGSSSLIYALLSLFNDYIGIFFFFFPFWKLKTNRRATAGDNKPPNAVWLVWRPRLCGRTLSK